VRRFWDDINPTLRGFMVIALIAGIVLVLELQATLVAISAILQVLFVLALVFFVYLVWRERRHEISMWALRARVTFYGAALLIVADIGAYWYDRPGGPDAAAFLLVLPIAAFSMWRVWRDQKTYS
jgi:ABC-type nickel/cobalt efflux system permease component RcnA